MRSKIKLIANVLLAQSTRSPGKAGAERVVTGVDDITELSRVAMAAVFGIIVEPWFHPLAKSCHLEHPTDPIAMKRNLTLASHLLV